MLGIIGTLSIAGIAVMVWPWPEPSPVSVTTNSQVTARAITTTINPAPAPSPTTTLTFVGDVMLDRYVRTTINQHDADWPFAKIQPELIGHAVIGNLEGPITTNSSVATDTRLIFTFDPKHIAGLADSGFTHFSLANNHTLNFGPAGLDATRATLSTNGLKFFGDPKNRLGFDLSEKIGGLPIALIGYHGLVNGRDSVITEVQAAHLANVFVIVIAHWGNEYQALPSAKQTTDAHALIDAGADLIIGAHPHVVQPLEIYRDKLIVYSLGNFLFDQYFSEATERGIIARITIDEEFITAELIPTVTVAGQIERLASPPRETMLTALAQSSLVPDTQKPAISRGRLTLPNTHVTP